MSNLKILVVEGNNEEDNANFLEIKLILLRYHFIRPENSRHRIVDTPLWCIAAWFLYLHKRTLNDMVFELGQT